MKRCEKVVEIRTGLLPLCRESGDAIDGSGELLLKCERRDQKWKGAKLAQIDRGNSRRLLCRLHKIALATVTSDEPVKEKRRYARISGAYAEYVVLMDTFSDFLLPKGPTAEFVRVTAFSEEQITEPKPGSAVADLIWLVAYPRKMPPEQG